MARQSYRVKFPGGSGDQLAGIIDRPDDHPAGPVLVFSHCFTCNKDLKSTVRLSRAMSEKGVAVLRFDMTGLGGSEGDFSGTSFTTNLADLASAIRFAAAEIGPVTTLLGHSFGGAASLALAGQAAMPDAPAELASLQAIVTLAAPSDTTHLAALLASMNGQIERTGVGDVSIGGFDWTIRREMLQDLRSHHLPELIAQITCPVMLMHSPSDKTVGFDHALRIMSLIQGSPRGDTSVSLLSLGGADHLLAENQADIDFVASTVAAFAHRHFATI
ncbi:MAG: alpha/beta fold hydrolase [Pirellulaceae bacterium]|nr:alpha/beta fold hydrolase [Pirellulaceae bacterium]